MTVSVFVMEIRTAIVVTPSRLDRLNRSGQGFWTCATGGCSYYSSRLDGHTAEGLVFREARIVILPCHAASTLSTEHPLVIHATAKKNSVAWKWPVNAVKKLLELQNETGTWTSRHSAAVPDTNAEIKY